MNFYTHIIWDFNGTLLDDTDVCLRCANALLTSHGLPPIPSVERYRELFGFPIIDYYRRLGFDFSVTPYAELAVEWIQYYSVFSHDAKLYPYTADALRAAQDAGLCQIILSASEKSQLEGQLSLLGIRHFFDEVLGLDNIHAYSKLDIGLAWRKQNPDARLLLLGDTEHDAAVAQALGADCILLASGHRPRAALEKCPCLTVRDAEDTIDAENFRRLFYKKSPSTQKNTLK